MKRLFPLAAAATLLGFAAHAQDADIAAVLGEAQALGSFSEICPGLYPDMAVIDASEENVWQVAVSRYGEAQATEMLSSPAMERAVLAEARVTMSAFAEKAGGADKICAYAANGGIIGVTAQPTDDQPDTDTNPEPEPAAPEEAPLSELVPEY